MTIQLPLAAHDAVLAGTMLAMGEAARAASAALAKARPDKRTAALKAMAARIRAAEPAILAANAKDMDGGRDKGLTGAMLDRLELTCVLQPLGESETAAYVRHRLQAAGATTAVFADAALATVHQLSGGLPRRINRLCDFALLVGYADNLSEITATQVEAVAEELMPVAA